MIRKGKPLFDPKVFLSKVNGGEPFPIIGRIKLSTRRVNPRIRFLHSERQGQEDRHLRAGEGSRGRTSGNPAISLGKGV